MSRPFHISSSVLVRGSERWSKSHYSATLYYRDLLAHRLVSALHGCERVAIWSSVYEHELIGYVQSISISGERHDPYRVIEIELVIDELATLDELRTPHHEDAIATKKRAIQL